MLLTCVLLLFILIVLVAEFFSFWRTPAYILLQLISAVFLLSFIILFLRYVQLLTFSSLILLLLFMLYSALFIFFSLLAIVAISFAKHNTRTFHLLESLQYFNAYFTYKLNNVNDMLQYRLIFIWILASWYAPFLIFYYGSFIEYSLGIVLLPKSIGVNIRKINKYDKITIQLVDIYVVGTMTTRSRLKPNLILYGLYHGRLWGNGLYLKEIDCRIVIEQKNECVRYKRDWLFVGVVQVLGTFWI